MKEMEFTVVRRPGIVARRVAGEMLLIPINARALDTDHRTAEMFVLNPTGERLWQVLEHPSTVDELARNLMEWFEVSEPVARRDVAAFVSALTEMGMIVQHRAGADANS